MLLLMGEMLTDYGEGDCRVRGSPKGKRVLVQLFPFTRGIRQRRKRLSEDVDNNSNDMDMRIGATGKVKCKPASGLWLEQTSLIANRVCFVVELFSQLEIPSELFSNSKKEITLNINYVVTLRRKLH